MKISVIIPAYNTEPYLRNLLSELLRQKKNYPLTEVIVVDDGSGYFWLDGLDLIAIHQENKGEAAARNTGLNAATGEYIAWIDSDDMITPDYLKTLYDAAESGKELYVFRWRCSNGVKGFRWSNELPYYNVWSYLYKREKISVKFNERISYTCDIFWLRENEVWKWDREEIDHEIIIYNESRPDSLTAQFNRKEIGIWKD